MRHLLLGGLVLLTFVTSSVAEEMIPRFLTGRLATENVPPETWSAEENIAWKTDLEGLGWSTPIVTDGKIFLTAVINTGEGIAPRKGLYIEDLDANKYPKETNPHLYKVFCLDLDTGDVLWEQTAHEGIPPKPHHLKNTLASETCATDGERVYARFGNIGLFCYDLDGNLQWEHREPAYETRYNWGTSQSPIVYKGRVYLCNDNDESSTLATLDAKTGEVIWQIPREEETNYSTPFIWENELRTEVVISGIGWARSYDLEGKDLWWIKGKSILAIPTPFDHEGLLYVTSGHVLWGENPAYAIRPGASGDISPAEGETSTEYIAWYQPKAGPYHPTPLIVDGTMHFLLDRGFMAAYNAETGEEVYSKKRIPKGRAFTASPVSYNGKLFCVNEDGVTFVIQTGADFEILHTNPLGDDDMCMASPVIVGDRLLIRSSERVYCIRGGSSPAAGGD